MAKIENEIQYKWAVERVEKLLPLVDDSTPLNDPNSIELELLSNMVADYSEEHFSLGNPPLADVIKLPRAIPHQKDRKVLLYAP